MFDKFGEFDSAEELNAAAAGLKAEGDRESLLILAEENGIDKEDAEDYMDGYSEELATVYMAAYGKLKAEEQDTEKSNKNTMEKMALKVIMNMLKGMCSEEAMAAAVRKKGKRAAEVLKAMKCEAERNKSGNMGVSCGTDRELCEIIKAYYTEPGKAFKDKIKALYK